MKKIYTFAFMLLALSFVAPTNIFAGDPPTYSGVHLDKRVTSLGNGEYKLTLETFVEGNISIQTQALPLDIVLVLDVSGSMSNTMSNYSYTSRGSKPYSYSSCVSHTYYYKDDDDNYFQVESSQYSQKYYLIYKDADGKTHYLTGTESTTTRPDGPTRQNVTIWTGELYSRTSSGSTTRMAALQSAVNNFIESIYTNATKNPDGSDRSTPIDHKISIVKYAGDGTSGATQDYFYNNKRQTDPSLEAGNYALNGTNIDDLTGSLREPNAVEVVYNLSQVSENNIKNNLRTAINNLKPFGTTKSNKGMQLATMILSTTYNEGYYVPGTYENPRQSVVVLFTDGVPCVDYNNNFSNSVANGSITCAYTLKASGAKVFTIGVFDNLNDNIRSYMEGVSSNYPNATDLNNLGERAENPNYFMNAQNPDELNSIFQLISKEIGDIVDDFTGESVVRDIITTDFSLDLPDGSDTKIIKAYTQACEGVTGTGPNKVFTFSTDKTDITKDLTIDSNSDSPNNSVSLTGFDFSENWCGIDESSTSGIHGNKLVLEIPIKINPLNHGGTLPTNAAGSGLYVDGNATEPAVPYPVPNLYFLVIKKEGLNKGESAIFNIYKGTGTSMTFLNKVLLTGSGTPYAVIPVTELTSEGVPATTQYTAIEESWSWSYTGDSIKEITDFPINGTFEFSNLKSTTVPDHAESVVKNDFSRVESSGSVNGETSNSKPYSE